MSSFVNFILCIAIILCFNVAKICGERSFQIDYLNNTFLKDGVPYRYVSGSMHYSRVHPSYWKDRLIKMKFAGLNAVQGYVPWNVHELTPGNFTWEGSSNLTQFLEIAQEVGIDVLLRLGPYICGEWEFGGFPAWLLTKDANMVLRTSDPSYIRWVDRWYTELLTKIKPYLYNNGGPVLMVQIENEYGSYFACDYDYLHYLRDKVKSILGPNVVIYSTDGGADYYLKCGKIDGVYATIDFGATNDPVGAFQSQRDYEPYGPLVNSEFYVGWLDHWGTPHEMVDSTPLAKSLDKLLAYGANINMYMFVGGTNFGFYNGANSPPYQPVPTSYDYDSPISEGGEMTDKFLALRDIISKYLPLPSEPIPANPNITNLGEIPIEFLCTIQDALPYLTPEGPYRTVFPVTMEEINFYEGFILYRFTLIKNYYTPTPLVVPGIRDRGVVMVNAVPFGILDRVGTTQVSITGTIGQQVDILVENQGRVGYSTAMNFNTKGIIENVTLGNDLVMSWEIYPIHAENINVALIAAMKKRTTVNKPSKSVNSNLMTPSIYTGSLTFPDSPTDAFLDPRPWIKGQAFLNSFNLGRYWPYRGPQVTLYIPKYVFNSPPALNHILLLELESSPCFMSQSQANCYVTLTDTAYLNGPNGPGHTLKLPQGYNDPNSHLVH
ncbi:beta-galactosidase [Biomphalaria glabrata]|uniref:Beta-galactosidase n=1 Tax=Biomphalaria glabrata TaxID=6526 RepID=A0A9W3AJX9_BIOGL|nr:beta-galactosidase-like [Biomphalaria glabrata]